MKYCALTRMVRILTMERKTFVMSAMLLYSINCWIHVGRIQFATVIMNEQLRVEYLKGGRRLPNNILFCLYYVILWWVLPCRNKILW